MLWRKNTSLGNGMCFWWHINDMVEDTTNCVHWIWTKLLLKNYGISGKLQGHQYFFSRPISQIPLCIRQISHNASFSNWNMHTSARKWCIAGCGTGTLWELCDRSIHNIYSCSTGFCRTNTTDCQAFTALIQMILLVMLVSITWYFIQHGHGKAKIHNSNFDLTHLGWATHISNSN